MDIKFSLSLWFSLISLSLLAKEHSYTKPELTSDSVIYIKAGRYSP